MSHAVSKAAWESKDVIILDVVTFPDARKTDTSAFGSQIFLSNVRIFRQLRMRECVEFNP